jgi:hypothetical protein
MALSLYIVKKISTQKPQLMREHFDSSQSMLPALDRFKFLDLVMMNFQFRILAKKKEL